MLISRKSLVSIILYHSLECRWTSVLTKAALWLSIIIEYFSLPFSSPIVTSLIEKIVNIFNRIFNVTFPTFSSLSLCLPLACYSIRCRIELRLNTVPVFCYCSKMNIKMTVNEEKETRREEVNTTVKNTISCFGFIGRRHCSVPYTLVITIFLVLSSTVALHTYTS